MMMLLRLEWWGWALRQAQAAGCQPVPNSSVRWGVVARASSLWLGPTVYQSYAGRREVAGLVEFLFEKRIFKNQTWKWMSERHIGDNSLFTICFPTLSY